MADAAPRPSFSQRLREMAIGGMGGSTTPTPTATPTPTPVSNEPPVPSRARVTAELADIITGGFLGLTQNRLEDERNRHLQELEQARQNRDIAKEQKVADNAAAEIAKPRVVRRRRNTATTSAAEALSNGGIGLNPIESAIEAKPKKARKSSTKSSTPKRSTQAMELAKIAAAQNETNVQLANIDDKLGAIHLVMNEVKIGILKMNTKPLIGSGGIPASSWFANGIPGIDPRPQNASGTSIAGIAPIPMGGGGGNTPTGRAAAPPPRVPGGTPRVPLARFGPGAAIAGVAIVGGMIAEHLIDRYRSANSTPEPSTPEERRTPETDGDTPQQTQALQEVTRARTDGLITDVQATALRRQITSGNPQEVIDHLSQLRRNRPPTPATTPSTNTPAPVAPRPTPPAPNLAPTNGVVPNTPSTANTTPRPSSDVRERNRNIAEERSRILNDDSLSESQREAALRALSMRHFQEHTGTDPTSTFRNNVDWYTPNTTPQLARPNTLITAPRVLATANVAPTPSITPAAATAAPVPMSDNITIGGLKPDAPAANNKIETNIAPVATGAGTSPTGPTVNADGPAGEPGPEIERRRRVDSDFITEFTPLAERVAARLGVPARTILAHWSLETNNGRAFAGRNNLGNMTGTSRQRTTAGSDTDGAGRQITQRFLDFDTPEAFADYYASWVERRAPSARNVSDPREYAQILRNASYATAPHFANAVSGVANRPAFAAMGTALPTTPTSNSAPVTPRAPSVNNAPTATSPVTASNVPATVIMPRNPTNIPLPPPPAPPVPVETETPTRIRETGMPMASLDGSFSPVERNPDAPYHTLTDFAVNDTGPRIVMASNDDQRPNEPPRSGDLPTGTHVNPYQVPSVRPDTHALQVLFGYPLA